MEEESSIHVITELLKSLREDPHTTFTRTMPHLLQKNVRVSVSLAKDACDVWLKIRVSQETPPTIDFRKYLMDNKSYMMENGRRVLDLRSMILRNETESFEGDFRLKVDLTVDNASELVDYFRVVVYT